ncbi:MAG TPA: SIR2 family protein [Pyrinomonadaceae bacterium]|jgi:hypothetical protein|nr:SIR2 family protein [Pyrinomonadaceae bacterium]
MAKTGIELKDLTPIIKERSATSGWALCVGAGTSVPAFPSWGVLVEQLARRDVGSKAADLRANLEKQFSYDALIQAAKDRLGYSDKKFATTLKIELYRNVKKTLKPHEWRTFLNAVSTLRVGDLKPHEWTEFLTIIRSYFSGMTALSIAEIISEVIETKHAPSAILSFNAEPLFVALINAFASARFAPSEKQVIDIVTRAISNRRQSRIPYFFCHGLLPTPKPQRRGPQVESVDKLVFSETSYLQLANLAFSWQSSVFIDVCSSRSVVFVGVSLTDPNMRRWLSWIVANRVQELRDQGIYRGVSTTHIWINKAPASSQERSWIESCVAHLGVRLVWIDDWDEVGRALRALLGR